jgi:hypothetical protein
MEILQEHLLNLIRDQCSSLWELTVFQDHIIINLPNNEEDFRSSYNKVKKEITVCVQQYLPERNADLLFEVRIGSWNCSFKLGKTVENLN